MTSEAWAATGNVSDVRPEQSWVRMTRREAGPAGRTGRWNHGDGEEMESGVGGKTQSEMRGSDEGGMRERGSGGDVVRYET